MSWTGYSEKVSSGKCKLLPKMRQEKTIGFIYTKNKIKFLIISLPKINPFHLSAELKKQANP